MKRATPLAWILLLLYAVAALAEPIEDEYLALRLKYRNFLADVGAQKNRTNWDKFIVGFAAFTEKHATHPRADDALFLAGDAQERLAKWTTGEAGFREALKSYDALARVYADSNLADDALWRAGQILELKLNSAAEAYLLYRTIVDSYPDSDMFVKAREGMERLNAFAPAEVAPPVESPPAPATPTEPPSAPAGPPPPATTPPNEASPSAGSAIPPAPAVVVESAQKTASPAFEEMTPRPATTSTETAAPPLPVPVAAGVNRLTRLAVWSLDGHAFLTFYLDAPVKPEMLARPSATEATELCLTLPSVVIAGDFSLPPLVAPLIALTADSADGRLLVRMQARALQGYSVNQFDSPSRLVIELRASPAEQDTAHASRHNQVVVLDPGHGGEDLGAHNRLLVEKKLTLDLAKKVRERLQKQSGTIVLLTRENDLFLPLDTRFGLANDIQATAFVSLHVNASPRSESNGVESYWYAPAIVPAEDDTVRFENESGQNHNNYTYPYIAPEDRVWLRDESRRLAERLQPRLLAGARQSRARAANRGIKSAPLLVLAGARVPAVLVEIGFATNPDEAKLLSQDAYLDRLADGLADGIRQYLDDSAAGGD